VWDFNVAFGFQNQKKRTKQRFLKIKNVWKIKKTLKNVKKRDQNKNKNFRKFLRL